MGWLRNLLSLGRLKGEPKDQNAGRVLGPASVQRTQLGLKTVDLPKGVVGLRSGEVRCFLQVGGYAAHFRAPDEARAWLQGYARALNTLPGNAVLIARSRPGGLQKHIRRQRAQAAALAKQAPGSALARLAADQLAHARTLQATGQVRQTDQYVALHSPKGDVARLLAAARACAAHLRGAGVTARLVTDRALLDHLAASWDPPAGGTEHLTQDFECPPGTVVGVLAYSPRYARVTEPEYPELPDAGADVRQLGAPPARPQRSRSLSQSPPNGKALPR